MTDKPIYTLGVTRRVNSILEKCKKNCSHITFLLSEINRVAPGLSRDVTMINEMLSKVVEKMEQTKI